MLLKQAESPQTESVRSSLLRPPYRILLADDHQSLRDICRVFLQQTPFYFRILENGAEAVTEFERAATAGSPYDLVVLDMSMPVLGGVQAAERIREFEAACGTSPVPIAFMTSYHEQLSHPNVRELATAGIWVKPGSICHLAENIAHALHTP